MDRIGSGRDDLGSRAGRGDKIDWDVSCEVDGEELTMIQSFQYHLGPLGSSRTGPMAPPRANGLS